MQVERRELPDQLVVAVPVRSPADAPAAMTHPPGWLHSPTSTLPTSAPLSVVFAPGQWLLDGAPAARAAFGRPVPRRHRGHLGRGPLSHGATRRGDSAAPGCPGLLLDDRGRRRGPGSAGRVWAPDRRCARRQPWRPRGVRGSRRAYRRLGPRPQRCCACAPAWGGLALRGSQRRRPAHSRSSTRWAVASRRWSPTASPQRMRSAPRWSGRSCNATSSRTPAWPRPSCWTGVTASTTTTAGTPRRA